MASLSKLIAGIFSAKPFAGFASRRHVSTSRAITEPLMPGSALVGDSGRAYRIDEIIVDRQNPPLCVYRASAWGQKYLVKNIIPGDFEYECGRKTSSSIHFCVETCFGWVQQTWTTRRGRASFDKPYKGWVDMHDRDVVHNDIKPNNIFLDYSKHADGRTTIEKVQIGDLEDAVILSVGEWLNGPLCGNALWRSPESWCRAYQDRASDVFSFAIVMIYVMLNRMVFLPPKDQLDSKDAWRHILRRHISYFGDEDNLNEFLQHIGTKNTYFDGIVSIAGSFGDVDPDFRDLVCGMTSLGPKQRITARQALEHRWFSATIADKEGSG